MNKKKKKKKIVNANLPTNDINDTFWEHQKMASLLYMTDRFAETKLKCLHQQYIMKIQELLLTIPKNTWTMYQLTLAAKTGPTLYKAYLSVAPAMLTRSWPAGMEYSSSFIMNLENCSILLGLPPTHTNWNRNKKMYIRYIHLKR